MDKHDWSPLLQLALGDATMLKELLREPIVEEKPEPGEEIVPAMAQALADWAALLPGDVVTLGGDPTYPMPPVLRSGDGWLDFYELAGGEEAERVDTLAGDFNRYAAAHPQEARAVYRLAAEKLKPAGKTLIFQNKPAESR